MKDPNEGLRRDVALFRYGVIADILAMTPGTPEIGDQVRAQADRDHAIPGSRRTRVAEQTLRDWIRLYRKGGFDALHPKRRLDRGKPRRMTADAAGARPARPDFAIHRFEMDADAF